MLKSIFWILWSIELVFMLWWLNDELKLVYLRMNPVVPFFFLWLAIALALQLLLKNKTIALVLVAIPAVPLAIMALFALVIILAEIFGGPIRWN